MEEGRKMIGKKSAKQTTKIVGIVVGIVCVCMVCLIGGFKLYYMNRWYPNTTINGLDMSGKKFAASEQMMQDYISSYQLTITGRDKGKLVISGKQIDLSVDYKDKFNEIYKEQKKASFLPNFKQKDYEQEIVATYSKEKVDEIINNASIVKGDDKYQIVKPKSAYVQYNESDGYGEMIEEEMGNKLVVGQFLPVVYEAIASMDTKLDLTKDAYQDVYKKPKFTSEDEILQTQYNIYNTYLLNWINWDMGDDVTESITPSEIKDWLHISKNGSVELNEEAMSEWIENFCKKYKTEGMTRTFTTHSGKKIQVEGGDYGWRLDYDAIVKQVKKLIKRKGQKRQEKVKAYMADTSQKNKEALTTNLKPIYSNTAFQKDNGSGVDWDTNNYSEVDLTAQMVYVYKDGELAYSTKCVTGLATDPERATRTGCYYIKDKKEEYVLVGEDYETPTKYWVRIMWTGTGYHYLQRSDWSNWSPEIYKTRGSHGCINLQLEDAKSIYDLVKLGDAVFIHN